MSIRFVLLTVIWLTACTPLSVTTPDMTQIVLPLPVKIQSTHVPTQEESSNMNPFLTTSINPGLQSLIEKAKGNLAQQLSISATQIKLVKVLQTVWLDSSLECPQAGAKHIQEQTEGFLISLEGNGKIYEYHTDSIEQIVLCNSAFKETDTNVDDGWPNQTKDKEVIVVTPTLRQ